MRSSTHSAGSLPRPPRADTIRMQHIHSLGLVNTLYPRVVARVIGSTHNAPARYQTRSVPLLSAVDCFYAGSNTSILAKKHVACTEQQAQQLRAHKHPQRPLASHAQAYHVIWAAHSVPPRLRQVVEEAEAGAHAREERGPQEPEARIAHALPQRLLRHRLRARARQLLGALTLTLTLRLTLTLPSLRLAAIPPPPCLGQAGGRAPLQARIGWRIAMRAVLGRTWPAGVGRMCSFRGSCWKARGARLRCAGQQRRSLPRRALLRRPAIRSISSSACCHPFWKALKALQGNCHAR